MAKAKYMEDTHRKGYAVTPVGEKMKTRSISDAVDPSNNVDIETDEMNGGREKDHEYLRMEPGNILEARGRDVSNSIADVDGWGDEDPPYRGMGLDDTGYGPGAGMSGNKTSRGRRE